MELKSKQLTLFVLVLLLLQTIMPYMAKASMLVPQENQTLYSPIAKAQAPSSTVSVYVTIVYIDFKDSIDVPFNYLGDPYFKIEVEGIERTTGQQDNIDNGSINLGVEIIVPEQPTYDITIQCWDADPYPDTNDHCDISGNGVNLDITYDPATDTVSGDDDDFHASGEDDGSITTDEDDVEIEYDILVSRFSLTLTLTLIIGTVIILVIIIVVYLIIRRRRSHAKASQSEEPAA